MASRKAQREEARARRLAEEKARQERERRTRRLRMIGGIVVAAVAVAVVAIAISSGGGHKGGLAKGATATKTVSQVQALLNGIPQDGARLGNPKAPVTMTYYGDLQCPVCQAFTLNGFQQLVSKDVREGKVQVVYKALQTATRDQQTFQQQQVAALAAGEQQRFWNYVELFYHQQGQEGSGYVNEAFLNGLAQQVPGLNISTWTNDRGSSSLSSQIPADANQAAAVGANATPTLVFKGPKGQAQPVSGDIPYSSLQQTIQSVS
jgi:protein-disulfide isomerase